MNTPTTTHTQAPFAPRADSPSAPPEPTVHEIREFLRTLTHSGFARSVLAQMNTGGKLSPKQRDVVMRMWRERKNPAEKPLTQLSTDQTLLLQQFVDRFGAVKGERAQLRVGDIAITRAGSNSATPGALYVKVEGAYVGKITRGGSHNISQHSVVEAVIDIARDPSSAAIRHGKITGQCACCGRELTNPESIERGIGPICAGQWGF